ncbi:MAG: hypothetical protein R3181_15180, partial [Rubricoccaceae bacterium]|nr:hypothetical protein [Rubricoccaceae bacterium]
MRRLLCLTALLASTGLQAQPVPTVDLDGDATALILDGTTGTLLGTQSGDGYSTLEVHEDGRFVTFGSGVLWQTVPWRRVARLETTALDGLQVSADGRRVLAGDVFTGWSVLSLPEGTPVRTFRGQGDALAGFAFSPDGRLFAANGACAVLGCDGATQALVVYDAEDGTPQRAIPVGQAFERARVSFSGDGAWVGLSHPGEGVAA